MSSNFKAQALVALSIVIACHCASVSQRSKDFSADQYPQKWNDYAKQRLDKMLTRQLNGNVAKNIVLMLGDGMGITTVTAGRILKGQMQGGNGEEFVSAMEGLDHAALSKTYNIDAQTPDSAGTGTAYLTGVKTRIGAIGVDGRAVDCATTQNSKLDSVLKWAHKAGKSVGFVTTARISHATPAALYANVPDRDMEVFDGKDFTQEHYDQGCRDIASQLVDENSFIDVIFGGGRKKFLRTSDPDPKSGKLGERIDGRNLIEEWQNKMKSEGRTYKYIWNLTEFENLKPGQYERVLGVLSRDHMDYELERLKDLDQPSISAMTQKAIEILSRNPNGYFLLVEGAKIDQGHHEGVAKLALNDYVAFDNAVQVAKDMVDTDETLLITTADHSHVFTLGGYSFRGQPLFDINKGHEGDPSLDKFNKTYTHLGYANGPGGLQSMRTKNLTDEQTNKKSYTQEAAVYLPKETHGGEDVPIYASGPMAFLFDGTVEESFIAHVMAYSACIGPYHESVYSNCKGQRGFHTVQSKMDLNMLFGSSNAASIFSHLNLIYSLIFSISILSLSNY